MLDLFRNPSFLVWCVCAGVIIILQWRLIRRLQRSLRVVNDTQLAQAEQRREEERNRLRVLERQEHIGNQLVLRLERLIAENWMLRSEKHCILTVTSNQRGDDVLMINVWDAADFDVTVACITLHLGDICAAVLEGHEGLHTEFEDDPDLEDSIVAETVKCIEAYGARRIKGFLNMVRV